MEAASPAAGKTKTKGKPSKKLQSKATGTGRCQHAKQRPSREHRPKQRVSQPEGDGSRGCTCTPCRPVGNGDRCPAGAAVVQCRTCSRCLFMTCFARYHCRHGHAHALLDMIAPFSTRYAEYGSQLRGSATWRLQGKASRPVTLLKSLRAEQTGRRLQGQAIAQQPPGSLQHR